jgi:site-specific recombinase XerD
MEKGTLLAQTTPATLSEARFAELAAVPPEVEWFANLTNPNTRRAYKSDVRGFMGFLGIIQPEELRRVTRAHVLAWRKTIGHQAPATVRRKIAAVASLFDYLCDRNAVPGNPASGVQRPKEGANQGKTPAISDRQARQLLAAPSEATLTGKRDRAILAVFLFHGPRRAEVAGLRVGDLQDRRGVPHLMFRGKGGKIRYLPAHPVAVAAVRDYLAAAGHGGEAERPLFRPLRNRSSAAGTQAALSADSLWRIVMSYAAKVGIGVAGFGPHSLRATAATNALEHGADLAAVSEWLGHASVTTTRLYDKRVVRTENSPTFRVSY